MELSSPEISPQEPLEGRAKYYQNRVGRLLTRYGREFPEFIKGHEDLIEKGDEKIRIYQASGYNILRRNDHMPLTSKKPLIFYNNYIGRTRHFGLLLAQMEQQGMITSSDINLGIKASRVLYGNWELDVENERLIDFERVDKHGNISTDKVDQTMEGIVIFLPQNNDQALDIVDFLDKRARSGQPGAIEGSFEVPDVRATASLKDVLTQFDFKEVVANIISSGQGRLVIARQTTEFSSPWRKTKIGINEELASYLTFGGVPS